MNHPPGSVSSSEKWTGGGNVSWRRLSLRSTKKEGESPHQLPVTGQQSLPSSLPSLCPSWWSIWMFHLMPWGALPRPKREVHARPSSFGRPPKSVWFLRWWGIVTLVNLNSLRSQGWKNCCESQGRCGMIISRCDVQLERWQQSLFPSWLFGFIVLTTAAGATGHKETGQEHRGKILQSPFMHANKNVSVRSEKNRTQSQWLLKEEALSS